MTLPAILLPLFAQVLLTFVLLALMGRARFAVLREREVRIGDIALGQKVWPARAQQVSNAYHNQFETPLLFYVAVIVALITRKADLLFVVLSWLYVLARVAHAFVYVTSNHVPLRFGVFLAGTAILGLMWIVTAARILMSGA